MTRRTAVLLTLGAPGFHSRAYASSEFWNDKKSEDWSAKEIDRMLTRSPWAKEVAAVYNGGDRRTMHGDDGTAGAGRPGGRGGGGGMSGAGMGDGSGTGNSAGSGGGMGSGSGGGRGMGGGSGGGMGEGGGGQAPLIKALVRWETAPPIVAAKGKPLPSSVQGQYVVSVTGVPMMGGGANVQGIEERLKESTALERKGRDPINPAKVTGGRSEGTTMWIFFFPHGSQPIDADDKEVTFKTRIGPLEVKAKFALKEMKYQGQLAL